MAISDRRLRERQERERLIIEHADDLLRQHGFLGLNLDELAERVEYSKATLYNHFDSKEDLVAAVDLAVLAVGMVPGTARTKPSLEMDYDAFGFVTSPGASGIVPAGCVKAPMEVAASVQDSTAAALKAIQIAMGR